MAGIYWENMGYIANNSGTIACKPSEVQKIMRTPKIVERTNHQDIECGKTQQKTDRLQVGMVEIPWNPIRLWWGCISIRFIPHQPLTRSKFLPSPRCLASIAPPAVAHEPTFWKLQKESQKESQKEWVEVEGVKILHWEEYLLGFNEKLDEAFFPIYSIVWFYFSTLFGWFWGCYASAMAARQSQISVIDLPLPRSKRPPLNASVRPGCSMGRAIHRWSMRIYTWLGQWLKGAIHIASAKSTL